MRVLAILPDLIDLGLQVVDHLWGHVFSEDLEEVDPFVARDGFDGCQLDAFLHLRRDFQWSVGELLENFVVNFVNCNGQCQFLRLFMALVLVILHYYQSFIVPEILNANIHVPKDYKGGENGSNYTKFENSSYNNTFSNEFRNSRPL